MMTSRVTWKGVGGLSREERAKLNCKAALMDCDQALDLEIGNVKARYRKA